MIFVVCRYHIHFRFCRISLKRAWLILQMKNAPCGALVFYWRRGRDSNPRYLAVHTLSKRARSATLTPLREMECEGSDILLLFYRSGIVLVRIKKQHLSIILLIYKVISIVIFPIVKPGIIGTFTRH